VKESVTKSVLLGGGNATVDLKTFSLDTNHTCLSYFKLE